MNRHRILRAMLATGLCLSAAAIATGAAAQGLRQHAADFWDELKVVVGEGTVKRLRIEYENDVFYASDGRYWRYGLDIGCIGPCAQGRQLQSWVQRNITNSPAPQGWNAQIRNELGAMARFEYAERLFHEPLAAFASSVFGLSLATDLRPHVSAGVGNLQIYAGAGVTARIGWFRTSYDSLRLDTHTLESLAGARRAPSSCHACGR